MRVVADFSFARHSGRSIRDAGFDGVMVYTGPARPTIAEVADYFAAGLSVQFIQETYSERASEGYAAGVADARYAEARTNEILDALGYPRTDEILYVVSDGNAELPDGAGVADYTLGLAYASQRPHARVYGNVPCVDAARSAGAFVSGTMVPDTWGARAGVDDVWQMANIASPLDGLDVDHAFVDFWGQTPNVGASAPPGKDLGMWCALRNDNGTVRAMFVGGDCKIDDASGAPGAFGIPQDAIDFHARGGELHTITAEKWAEIERRTTTIPDGLLFIHKRADGTIESGLVLGGVLVRTFGGPAGAFGIPQSAIAYQVANGTQWLQVNDDEWNGAKARALPPTSGGGAPAPSGPTKAQGTATIELTLD